MRSRRSGFTLIEMIVVITILALMAALIIPNFLAMKRSREQRTLEAELIRLPAEARLEAQRSAVAVTLRVDGDALVMERAPNQDESDPTIVKRLELSDEMRVDSAREGNQSIDLASWQWVVYPDGSADTAGLEFVEGESSRHSLLLPANSGENSRWLAGSLPEDNSGERWPAGDLEQRG